LGIGDMTVELPARYRDKVMTPEAAVALIRPGDVVLWGVHMEPLSLVPAIVKERERLRGVTMLHHTTWYQFPWFARDFGDHFRVCDMYPGTNSREAIAAGQVEFVPLSFGLLNPERVTNPDRGRLYQAPDVYLTRISPPDADGFVSLGVVPWFWEIGFATARVVIGELDPSLPRTSARVHLSQFHAIVPPVTGEGLPARPLAATPPDELEAAQVVGANAATLIRDRDTFQVGVGPAAEATVEFLRDRRDLGVHSELIFPGVVELVRDGVVTGAYKNVDRGKVVTAGLIGNPNDPRMAEAVRFVSEHPDLFEFRTVPRVANLKVVAEIENFVAVNNVLAVDLTGQVVINFLGTLPIAGIGGNFDFIVGSHYAKGGRGVYCLLSTAQGGHASRIVPQIPHGPYQVVAVPNYMVDYLVTEHGIVNLEGKSLRQRAEAIISIAHPDFRAELRQAARTLGLL
jgi:4-hydroxybutyrate CoA-transferase